MGGKKKRPIMELRYYQMPHGLPFLALLGDKWIQNYGKRNWDRLHFHNYLEIGYCYYGSGDMVLGEEKYRFTGEQLTVIPANYLHTTTSDEGDVSRWEYLFVDVDGLLLRMFPDNKLKRKQLSERINARARFLEQKEFPKETRLILDILNLSRDREEFYIEEATALLEAFLLEMARMNKDEVIEKPDVDAKDNTAAIVRAIDFISNHYMEQIRVEDLAKNSHLSETHFRRLFTEYMRVSPLEYINIVRVQAACELLKRTDEAVGDIAHKCGFITESTFHRNFGKIMRMTPQEWRKMPENYEQKIRSFDILKEQGW